MKRMKNIKSNDFVYKELFSSFSKQINDNND